jgi:hypothetical protein
MNTRLIENKFNVLPDDLKREVLDFIDFLMAKRRHEKILSQFDFTWEGGLTDFKDDFSSVDLQHRSMDWR